jgi:hypothetical protein
MRTIAWIWMLAVAMPAHAERVVTVGADREACDFVTIEAAIAAAPTAGVTRIRIANDARYAGVRLGNGGRALVLQGGYLHCDQARDAASGSGMIGDIRTVISAEAAFEPAPLLRLENLDLLLHAPLRLQGPLELELENSSVRSASGAGIELDCRGATLRLHDSDLRLRALASSNDCLVIGERGMP